MTSPALVIDGRAAAAAVLAQVGQAAAALRAATGVVPGLAVVLAGEDAASRVYVAAKGRAAAAAGFHSVQHDLAADVTQAALLTLVGDLNADPAIHGILVQLPLPPQVAAAAVLEAIAPLKDVDGFHPLNAGRLATGQGAQALVPCTPAAAMLLLRRAAATLGRPLAGLEALVIGRSNIVGKPMATLLLEADCTVTIAHSRTRDLAAAVARADVLVAAAGRPAMVRGDWIKPGAIVIDVGINRVPKEGGGTRLVGDVETDAAARRAGAITPVPGGVGPMTIAMLMANTLAAACRSTGRAAPALTLP